MLWWLAQHLLVTAGLAAVVGLACRGLRLSPALRHALWLGVLLKLLVPPLILLAWPETQAELVEPSSAPLPPAMLAPPASKEVSPASEPPLPAPVPATPVATIPAPEPPSTMPPAIDTPAVPVSWTPPISPAPSVPWDWSALALTLIGAIWLVGSLVFVVMHLVRIVRLSEASAKPSPRRAG